MNYPCVNILPRSDVHFKARFAGTSGLSPRMVNGAAIWQTPDLESKLYRYKDGVENEITLFRRPQSNVLVFDLDTRGTEILYQPFLAHVDRDGSSWEPSPLGGTRRRPAHINGSYAVYIDGLYGQGKFLHIPRPRPYDAAGHRVWADMRIENGKMYVTLPWEFLNTAVYPIYHAAGATFGYTTHGGSDDNGADNWLWNKATSTPGSNGTLTSMTIYGRQKTSAGAEFDPSIYSDSSGAPGSRLAKVDSGGTAFGASDSEITTNISYGSIGSGVQYWLGYFSPTWIGSGGPDFFFKYDSNGGATELYFLNDSSNSPWPATASGATGVGGERTTIFATYTPGGGGGGGGPLSNGGELVHGSLIRGGRLAA